MNVAGCIDTTIGRAALAAAIVAGTTAGVFESAVAADTPTKRDIFYSGDPVFCPKLLRGSHRIRFLKPVLGPSDVYDLGIGDNMDPRTRVYFPDPSLSDDEITRRLRRGGWKTIMKTVPPDADRVPARMVWDAGWSRYGRNCPELFVFRVGGTGEVFDVPQRIALYEFDVNRDGVDETILWRDQTILFWEGYDVVDFKTCRSQALVWFRGSTEPFEFDGRMHVASINHRAAPWIFVYRINQKTKEVDFHDHTCVISGIARLDEYVRDPSRFHKPKPEE